MKNSSPHTPAGEEIFFFSSEDEKNFDEAHFESELQKNDLKKEKINSALYCFVPCRLLKKKLACNYWPIHSNIYFFSSASNVRNEIIFAVIVFFSP